MSSNSSSSKSTGMGCASFFIVLLQVLLIGLKFTGYIDWTWKEVFYPFIFYGLVSIWALVAFGGFALIVTAVSDFAGVVIGMTWGLWATTQAVAIGLAIVGRLSGVQVFLPSIIYFGAAILVGITVVIFAFVGAASERSKLKGKDS